MIPGVIAPLAAAAFVILATRPSSPPVTLLRLIEEADLIVLANVEGVGGKLNAVRAIYGDRANPPPEAVPVKVEAGETSVALLRIERVLKGNAEPNNRIRVPFLGSTGCPKPARYLAAESVLVFLRKNAAGWRTCHRGDGTRVINEPVEIETYSVRIRELLNIIERDDENERGAETIDWLVRCIEHPTTRWDGAYELCGVLKIGFSRREQPFEASLDDLSQAQRGRILHAFMSSRREELGSWKLGELVAAFYDAQPIKKRLSDLGGLRLYDEAIARSARSTMLELVDLLGWPEGREIAQSLVLGENTPRAQAKARFRIVRNFRREALKRERLCSRRVKRR